MAQIKIDTTITVDDLNSATLPLTTTKTVTYTSKVDKEYTITASSTQVLWDPTTDATEATSDFDVLILIASAALEVELTINEGDGTEELNSFRLAADTPFILAADDAYYNHSASDIYAGTLDVIDKIRVKELNAASPTLRMILCT